MSSTAAGSEPSAFFPPLADLLSGSARLISLHSANDILSVAPDFAANSEALEKFCYDAHTFTLLSSAPDALPRPSAASKSDYEARTAPIQVNGSQNGDYDLEQMKKDALELSRQLDVEESFALRVVVLEWQSRAEDQVIRGGSEDSTRAGELGASVLGRSMNGLSASTMAESKSSPNYTDESTRRRRQLNIFLKERSSRLNMAANLLSYQASREAPDVHEVWTDDFAAQLFKDRFKTNEDGSVAERVFDKCMTAMDEQLSDLDDTSKLPPIALENAETMLMYAAATFNDVMTTLRILLMVLHVRDDLPSAHMVTSWFQKLESVNFFLTLAPSPAWPDITELQCLISLISFAILDAPRTVACLRDALSPPASGGVSYPRLDTGKYFEQEDCVRELNLIFYHAATNNITVLSPTTFVWAIITTLIRDAARLHTDMRERMIEDASSENEYADRRQSSRRDSREDTSIFERLYASLQDVEMEPDIKDDPPAWFAAYAVESVFAVVQQLGLAAYSTYTRGRSPTQFIARSHLLSLLREGLSLTFYGSEVLESMLTVLSPELLTSARSVDEFAPRLCGRFLREEPLRLEILEQALIRYPFELSPVLRLMTALSSASGGSYEMVALLDRLRTLTMMVPEHFNAYTLENEDENSNEIRIQEDLPLFVSRQALSLYGWQHAQRRALAYGSGEESSRGVDARSVPAGTLATVLKENRPMVLKLDHAHSGFEYLGLLLSTATPNSEMMFSPHQTPLDLVTAADIISLTTALAASLVDQPQGVEEAKSILERMSDALPDEIDIINVISQLFGAQLIAHLDQTARTGSLDILVAGAAFLTLVIKIEPSRTWASLAQSSLLGLNGTTNALAAIVGATETAIGQFKFLDACVAMYQNLVDDAIAGVVKRRPVEQPSTRKGRFDSPMEQSEHTPERTVQKVLSTFTTVMLEAWESIADWRFADPPEKSTIRKGVAKSFTEILRAAYGLRVDTPPSQEKRSRTPNSDQPSRLTGMLVPAADAIVDFFAPETDPSAPLRSSWSAFGDAATVFREDMASSGDVGLVAAITDLLASLLRVSKSKDASGKRAHHLATNLLHSMQDLTVIFSSQMSLSGNVAALLAEVTAALHDSNSRSSPPSLLARLSPTTAHAFLTVLTEVDRSLKDPATECQVWRFLGAVTKGGQNWLALYLLTGTMPRQRLDQSKTEDTKVNGKSLLTYALDQLSTSERLALPHSSYLLEFVSAAQSASVWASSEVRAHPSFLNNVVEWLNNLSHPDKLGTVAQQLLLSYETRKASLVCEVLAQAVHASIDVGDKGVLKLLEGKLKYLSAHGQSVDAYNRSLHLNLADNFRSRFSGLDLSAFERSRANPAEEYGKEWIYDIQLMDRVLNHERAWSGALSMRNLANGFRDEVARANVNLSLLFAQTTLLKSWSALAATIVDHLDVVEDDLREDLRKTLARAIENSLLANAAVDIDTPGTDAVLTMRAEMSFVVLTKLVSGTPTQEVKDVLPAAWRAVQRSPTDFDVATQEDDLHYYRLALQTLFLAIQPHAQSAPSSTFKTTSCAESNGLRATDETHIAFLDPSVAGVLMDIVMKCVAPVWRALAGNLHTNVACACPSDFALVTAILQAVLAVQGVGAVHTQIAEVVASMQLVRSALSLYSWADQLADSMDGNLVYGELAVQFLQVLSTIRPVAEHMALGGVLDTLSSANLSSYLRKPGGKGPFDEPRRMFTIWTECMLPLCLNLLDAVGPPVAAEVSGFLNSFPLQLERANTALENRDQTKFNPHAGAVTLGLVQEAHSLCLISMILQSDTARAAAEGIDALDVGGLRGYDYKKVVQDDAGLARRKASLASRITAANAVEAEWAERMVDGVDSWLSAKIIREVKELAGMGAEEESGSA